MTGIELIAAERERQISEEGWTAKHDDSQSSGSLALAATSYVMPADRRVLTDFTKDAPPIEWPWGDDWWKPTPNDRIRELTKAGALIAAEIDRLMRASAVRVDDAQ